MDNIRFGLLCAAAIICFFLYQAWQEDYSSSAHHHAQSAQTSQQSTAGSSQNDGIPDLEASAGSNAASSKGSQPSGSKAPSGEKIHVITDKFNAVISAKGGDLHKVTLRGVPVSDNKPDEDLRLINNSLPDFFIEQSGLRVGNKPVLGPGTVFASAKKTYRLQKGQDTLRVPLTWHDDNGHEVTKYYIFHRDSYKIDLGYKIKNNSDKPWKKLNQYVRYWSTPTGDTGQIPFSRAFFGAGWYQAKSKDDYSYHKRAHDDLGSEPLVLDQTGGWIALVQHYFLGAVIPASDAKVKLFAQSKPLKGASGAYAAGFVGSEHVVAPKGTADIQSALFIGPKHQDQLKAAAPGLGYTIDYGWLSVLSRPIFSVLNFLHGYVGNWGVAIILLTVLIKLLFYKLSEIQFRGMARMRKFQPRMTRLKEQYGDDRAELQKRMMELYKKEGFNPMAGCWPLLVQMPVFIALYWVLRESAELRQAPFILWIHDLSAPDPYFILPVIYGLVMFLQQKLNVTAVMDPMQQRIMKILPLGMAVFFCFFPAGLVLYWVTNSFLTIAQQWYIYRKLDNEGLGHNSTSES